MDMNDKFKRFRATLKLNKVFFETIATVMLAIMAIVVSIAQYITASHQTRLLALQTQIAEAQALPQYEIAIHQKFNSATGKYDESDLIVDNHGGPIHNFSAKAIYTLAVSFDIPRVASGKCDLFVNGYFTSQFASAAGTGVLVTMSNYQNNKRFSDLYRGASEAAEAQKWTFMNIEEQIIVRLHYRDLLDRSHEDYYYVPNVGGGWRMPDAEGKAAIERWSNTLPFELFNLHAEDLLNLATTSLDGTNVNPASHCEVQKYTLPLPTPHG
jgi:hypothetical protein